VVAFIIFTLYPFAVLNGIGSIFFWGGLLFLEGVLDLFLTHPSHYWGYVQLPCLLYGGRSFLLLLVAWLLAFAIELSPPA